MKRSHIPGPCGHGPSGFIAFHENSRPGPSGRFYALPHDNPPHFRYKPHVESFDVIIIGGGISGLGVARAATSAGYSTLVLEANTCGDATSNNTLRIIHAWSRQTKEERQTSTSDNNKTKNSLLILILILILILSNYTWRLYIKILIL
jgi:hypothetical protein